MKSHGNVPQRLFPHGWRWHRGNAVAALTLWEHGPLWCLFGHVAMARRASGLSLRLYLPRCTPTHCGGHTADNGVLLLIAHACAGNAVERS